MATFGLGYHRQKSSTWEKVERKI